MQDIRNFFFIGLLSFIIVCPSLASSVLEESLKPKTCISINLVSDDEMKQLIFQHRLKHVNASETDSTLQAQLKDTFNYEDTKHVIGSNHVFIIDEYTVVVNHTGVTKQSEYYAAFDIFLTVDPEKLFIEGYMSMSDLRFEDELCLRDIRSHYFSYRVLLNDHFIKMKASKLNDLLSDRKIDKSVSDENFIKLYNTLDRNLLQKLCLKMKFFPVLFQ